jgi:hypothetical protein
MHKCFNCLDVAEGCIYISRDVVFDETVYPFSKLNPNASSCLRSKILLLPSHSQPSHLPGHEDEILDLSSGKAPIILASANPSCSPKVSAEHLEENNVVFNRFEVVQARGVPSVEHDEDLSQPAAIPPTSDSSGGNPRTDSALPFLDKGSPKS